MFGKTLSKKDILKANDLKTVSVEVPQWGGSVYVQELSGVDRDKLESILAADSDDKLGSRKFQAHVVCLCVVNENGEKVFDESDVQDLCEKNANALEVIYEKAFSLSKLSDESAEELEKN